MKKYEYLIYRKGKMKGDIYTIVAVNILEARKQADEIIKTNERRTRKTWIKRLITINNRK